MKVELHPVSLKLVILVVPWDKKKKEMLVEDLSKMDCEGLFLELSALKSKAMV